MPWITLTGVPPYDGRYELRFDGDLFTIFEWGWIKRFAGYLPATLWDGFDGGDQELMAVFAVIALHRAGRITNRDAQDVFDKIGRGQLGTTLTIEADEEPAEDDAAPLPSRQTASNGSSGPGSTTSSESSDKIPPATGTPASDTSASASMTSAT